MKTSLRKLRGLALHKNDAKNWTDLQPLAQLDELAQASQDMQDMRDCYDSLLSAAAATANSAFEFSESLREMGGCFLQKTALNDDEETGKVLLMLGKVQYEVQKLVDSYRSHIFQTITIPSESLVNELRTVEEMKRQCDEKRDVFEHMKTRLREKETSKGGKGESFCMQQLQTARDEYDEEATLFIFRLKSLKQGQSRSLLTQAARHHSAQLCFFKKALKSLEGVVPHVKMVTDRQHIDYQFGGVGDDDWDNHYDDCYAGKGEEELSFDYGQHALDQDVSTSQNSVELDEADSTFPKVAKTEKIKEKFERLLRNSHSFKTRAISQSAPLLAENKVDSTEKLRQLRPSFTKKFHSYVLPTPVDMKASGNPVTQSKQMSLSEPMQNLRDSFPLEPKKSEKLGDDKISGPTATKVQSVLKESNNNIASSQLPPPLSDGLMFTRHDEHAGLDSKKTKRHTFSVPLTGKAGPNNPAAGKHPQLFSGPIVRNPMPQPPSLSPKTSSGASATFVSSPIISELHELPRPPVDSISRSSRPSGLISHSGPLISRDPAPYWTNRASNGASPLPKPPQSMSRSFSIPSNSPRVMELHVSQPLEAYQNSQITEDLASPSLSPTISHQAV